MASPLLSLPPVPVAGEGTVLPGGGWWPDVDSALARGACRIPDYVTEPRLVQALGGAMLAVTQDLAGWAAELATSGASSLAGVTAAQLAGLTVPDHRPAHHRHPWHRTRPRYGAAQAGWLTTALGGITPLVALYTRAVRFAAMAEIAEQYRDMATVAAKQPRAEAIERTGADYARLSLEARRDMLGTTRVAVELI